MTLFDLVEAQRRRDEGIDRASEAHRTLLAQAQAIALELTAYGREVTSDEVAAEMQARGLAYDALGNAAGGVFRSPLLEWTGAMRPSSRVSTHARLIRVWRRKPQIGDGAGRPAVMLPRHDRPTTPPSKVDAG